MTNNSSTPTADAEDMSYGEAEASVAAAQRRELVAKVEELRRQADAAKERAKAAQVRFERVVANLVSEKPERPDWYDYPGALPRPVMLKAAGLSTMALHRTMERYRKAGPHIRAAKRKTRAA